MVRIIEGPLYTVVNRYSVWVFDVKVRVVQDQYILLQVGSELLMLIPVQRCSA